MHGNITALYKNEDKMIKLGHLNELISGAVILHTILLLKHSY